MVTSLNGAKVLDTIVAAVWGGVTVLLLCGVFYYRNRAKYWLREVSTAEALRDEAVSMSARALEAKQNAEEGFIKAKDWFDIQNKRPLTATMTDQQCENVAKYVAGRVVGATRSISEMEQ